MRLEVLGTSDRLASVSNDRLSWFGKKPFVLNSGEQSCNGDAENNHICTGRTFSANGTLSSVKNTSWAVGLIHFETTLPPNLAACPTELSHVG